MDRIKTRVVLAAVAMAAGALVTCTVGPNYNRPKIDVPTTYSSSQPTTTQAASQPAAKLGTNWWTLFSDSQLTALEDAATKYNPDLQAAMQRVIQGRDAAKAVKSQFYPAIDLNPSIQQTNKGSKQLFLGGHTTTTYTVPFDLTYEVDVWGRVRRSYESAVAQAEATAYAFEVVLQTLQADVAQNYFNMRGLDAQSAILDENVQLYRRQLALIEQQVKAGIAPPTDALQVKTLLLAVESQAIDVKRQRNDAVHALAILTGRAPSELSLPEHPLKEIPPAIPAGLPSELLLRRPDVAQAEQSMVTANANVGVATANFYPKFTLTASTGLSSTDLGMILSPQSRFSSIMPAVSIPIFQGGLLTANLEQAKSKYLETYATYRSTVLSALRDVEDSLNDLAYQAKQAEAQDRAIASSRELLRLTEIQRKQGELISELQLIDADRTLLTNQLTANQILTQRQLSTVLLIKALGGGWEAPVTATQPRPKLTTLPEHSPTVSPTSQVGPVEVYPQSAATAPATLP